MELRDPLGLAASSAAVAVALEEEPAAPPTLCCCCCRDRCPDTHGIRQATYEVMTTGALEGSLSARGSERRWTFFAGTVVEVLVLFVIVVNCIYVLVDAETTVVAEQDGSAVGSAFVRAFALAAAWASRAVNDFLGFEVCSTAFFTLEYLARIWSTSVKPKYRGWRGRLRWARQPLQVIDLICLFAFYIDVLDIEKLAPQHWKLSGTIYFRMLRLLRLLSLFKMERQVRAFAVMQKVLFAKMSQLLVCLYAMIVIVALFGSLMYYIEAGDLKHGQLDTITDALYWAIQAITTVGIGTAGPGTAMGQIVSCVVSVLGVLFLAVPAGIVAAGFTEMIEEDRRLRAVAKSFQLKTSASRKAREKTQRAAGGGVAQLHAASGTTGDLGATVSDASVEAQSAPASPRTPPVPSGADPEQYATSAWAARLEERQTRLEESLERVEAMLSSLVTIAQQRDQRHPNAVAVPDSAVSFHLAGAE